jgi:hypothetical protein
LHQEVDRISALIAPFVRVDPTVDFPSWQREVEDLKDNMTMLRMKGERMRDASR